MVSLPVSCRPLSYKLHVARKLLITSATPGHPPIESADIIRLLGNDMTAQGSVVTAIVCYVFACQENANLKLANKVRMFDSMIMVCVCVCVSIWRKYLHFWQVYCCWIGSEIVGWECAKVFCAIVWSSLLLEDAFRLWIEMTVWDNSSWSRKSNIKVFALHFSIVRCMMLEICSKTSFIVIICFSFFSYLLNNPSFFNAFVFFFFFIFLHNDDSSIAETASYRW